MATRPGEMPVEHPLIGWDVGGAHLKACLLVDGAVHDVGQWACPLWQGLPQLDAALDQALRRWPGLRRGRHAVTMTAEMVDCFEDREDGVLRLVQHLGRRLGDAVSFYGGPGLWCSAGEAAAHWSRIASANWMATAAHAARWAERRCPAGLLVDIGSTTTDLVAFGDGRVLGASHGDAERLASGELVYHGVVRTPLCALAPRIGLRGTVYNVMNEFFATTADVYRLTGELDPAHDLHPAADGAAKDLAGSRRRLARMVGLDARDATPDDWLACARAWRSFQVAEIAGQLRRVWKARGLPDDAGVVAAGCGAFLLDDVLLAAGVPRGGPRWDYGRDLVPRTVDASDGVPSWARVCAPSVAVALLHEMEPRRCG
jgi:probable H4MPT-linked C1 transfer pathway protein